MKILQLVPTFTFGDAVGNDVLMLYKLIKNIGYETYIFYDNASAEAQEISSHFLNIPELNKNDIIIYHMAIASDLAKLFSKFNCRKIMIYHNITPSEYFRGYFQFAYKQCQKGLEEVKYLSDKVDYCLADSEFNKNDLINMGYRCKIDVLPILIPYDDYKKEPSKEIIKKYSDGMTNIVSVGRINAPNKKWENIIKTFYCYQENVDNNARLFLVGSYGDDDVYPQRIIKIVKELNIKNVIFTGHIPFNEILAYFKIADIYLCMSEHEGFCVPLIEAMLFKIPVVAYSTTAIPYTLNGSGFLLQNNDPMETAFVIKKIINDKLLKEQIIQNQNKRLEYFETSRVAKLFENYLINFINQ